MKSFPYRFLIVTFIVLLLDQGTKILVRQKIPYWNGENGIEVLGDFFRLIYVTNPGAAFSLSLGSDNFNRYFFTIVAIVVTCLIIYLMKNARHFMDRLAYSLIIGGAIGNTVDRVLYGAVTDFLDFKFFNFIFGLDRWPTFNIADSSIVCATVILLYYTIFIERNLEPVELEVNQPLESISATDIKTNNEENIDE
jgi:signal peptidase II